MHNYIEIKSVSPKELQAFLDKGWKIIDKTNRYHPPGDTFITFHIGYPMEKRLEELIALINEFEKRGFKEKLFEMIAKENGENLSDIRVDETGFGIFSETNTTKFMSNYDKLIRNKNVTYLNKNK